MERQSEKMAVLSFDTATNTLAVGLKKDGKIFEKNIKAERRHLELLFITIREVLQESKTDIDDLKAVGCGLGPGSFIGSRIAVVAAKTIAQVKGIPLVAMSTLDVIARAYEKQKVLVATDAMRGEIFFAYYSNGNRVDDIKVIKAQDFKKLIKEKISVTGDAIAKYPEVFKGLETLPEEFWMPKGRFLADLASEKLMKKDFEDIFLLNPIYVRDVDAKGILLECRR